MRHTPQGMSGGRCRAGSRLCEVKQQPVCAQEGENGNHPLQQGPDSTRIGEPPEEGRGRQGEPYARNPDLSARQKEEGPTTQAEEPEYFSCPFGTSACAFLQSEPPKRSPCLAQRRCCARPPETFWPTTGQACPRRLGGSRGGVLPGRAELPERPASGVPRGTEQRRMPRSSASRRAAQALTAPARSSRDPS